MPALTFTHGTNLKGQPVRFYIHVPDDFQRWSRRRRQRYLNRQPWRAVREPEPCPQFGGHWSDWPQVQ